MINSSFLRRPGCLLSLFVLVVLTGCSSGQVKIQYYTLMADQTVQNVAQLPPDIAVGIGPVELPGALDRREILSVTGTQEVRVPTHHYWVEDLKSMVSAVIALNVSHALTSDNVWRFPWDVRMRPQRQVSITFESFRGTLGGPVSLYVRWRLLDDSGGKVVAVKSAHYQQVADGDGYDAYVKAINQVINALSVDVAQSIAEEFMPAGS